MFGCFFIIGAARTCQWMHSATFSHNFLFAPRLWALQKLPVGVPSGSDFFNEQKTVFAEYFKQSFVSLALPTFIAPASHS